MIARGFCASGNHEFAKGCFHAATLGLLGIMAAYNVAAWCYRRERHLAFNAVTYTLGAAWELRKTRRHWG